MGPHRKSDNRALRKALNSLEPVAVCAAPILRCIRPTQRVGPFRRPVAGRYCSSNRHAPAYRERAASQKRGHRPRVGFSALVDPSHQGFEDCDILRSIERASRRTAALGCGSGIGRPPHRPPRSKPLSLTRQRRSSASRREVNLDSGRGEAKSSRLYRPRSVQSAAKNAASASRSSAVRSRRCRRGSVVGNRGSAF
ncbi:hypothetical protein D3C72_635420 [compost metagenome]